MATYTRITNNEEARETRMTSLTKDEGSSMLNRNSDLHAGGRLTSVSVDFISLKPFSTFESDDTRLSNIVRFRGISAPPPAGLPATALTLPHSAPALLPRETRQGMPAPKRSSWPRQWCLVSSPSSTNAALNEQDLD
eukprot:54601-Eustigmatos_ZCMA.PRE.1